MIENKTRLRVRYADTDQMGFCYYANYLKWFEIGRTEMLRDIDLPYSEIEKTGVALPVLEAHCKYHKPALYDQQVEVVSSLREFPRAKLKIEYAVYNSDKELLAEGYTIHTFINRDGKPVRPPKTFLDGLKEYFVDKRKVAS